MLRLIMLAMLVLLLAACEIEPIETGEGSSTPVASGPSRASVSGTGNDTKSIAIGSGTYNCVAEVSGNSSDLDRSRGRHASIWIRGDTGGALVLNEVGINLRDTSVERFAGGTYWVEADMGNPRARWSLVCSR